METRKKGALKVLSSATRICSKQVRSRLQLRMEEVTSLPLPRLKRRMKVEPLNVRPKKIWKFSPLLCLRSVKGKALKMIKWYWKREMVFPHLPEVCIVSISPIYHECAYLEQQGCPEA